MKIRKKGKKYLQKRQAQAVRAKAWDTVQLDPGAREKEPVAL